MSGLIFSSYETGPALNGYDCTGAESAGTGSFANPTGCSATGVSCHSTSATSTVTVALELDSSGIATTHYRPGKIYTIKLTGTNGTGTTFPAYGFQIAALKGTASAATNSDAGTFATTGLPTSTHVQPPGANTALTVAEHSAPLTLTGTSFSESFTWTAPTTNVGSISFWGAANFVTGSTIVISGDLWNTNHITIPIWPSTESVGSLSDELAIKAFPNPVTNNLNLQLDNAQPGTYSLQVFNLNGSAFLNQTIEVNSVSQATGINTSDWAPGLYSVVVEKDGSRKTTMVVKQ